MSNRILKTDEPRGYDPYNSVDAVVMAVCCPWKHEPVKQVREPTIVTIYPHVYLPTCAGGSGGPCTQPDCEICWDDEGNFRGI